MFSTDQYELLDFGADQKLERFGDTVVARSTPSAAGRRRQPEAWQQAELTYARNQWSGNAAPNWRMDFGQAAIRFELRTAPTGQVGVFPEQAVNWSWILNSPSDLAGCKALNLFGYTGGTTLALASRGVQVTHVDAAVSVVRWARRNAELSGLADGPIRWIVEDARQYLRREIKRGNRYDILVADPPSFGRGPKGQIWKFERDLVPLMAELAEVISEMPRLVMFSSHTPGFTGADWQTMVRQYLDLPTGVAESFSLTLDAATGQRLSAGDCFRWSY